MKRPNQGAGAAGAVLIDLCKVHEWQIARPMSLRLFDAHKEMTGMIPATCIEECDKVRPKWEAATDIIAKAKLYNADTRLPQGKDYHLADLLHDPKTLSQFKLLAEYVFEVAQANPATIMERRPELFRNDKAQMFAHMARYMLFRSAHHNTQSVMEEFFSALVAASELDETCKRLLVAARDHNIRAEDPSQHDLCHDLKDTVIALLNVKQLIKYEEVYAILLQCCINPSITEEVSDDQVKALARKEQEAAFRKHFAKAAGKKKAKRVISEDDEEEDDDDLDDEEDSNGDDQADKTTPDGSASQSY